MGHWNKHYRSRFSSKYKLTVKIFPGKIITFYIFFSKMTLQLLPVVHSPKHLLMMYVLRMSKASAVYSLIK